MMIIIKSITPIVRCEKLKIENHFYEMLTATVSHDMRTPLNAILNLLENLEPCVRDEKGRKFLKVISYSSKILLFLVNDLLDLFQIKNGIFQKHEAPINIKQSVQQLLEIFSVGAMEKKINIQLICDPSVPDNVITD